MNESKPPTLYSADQKVILEECTHDLFVSGAVFSYGTAMDTFDLVSDEDAKTLNPLVLDWFQTRNDVRRQSARLDYPVFPVRHETIPEDRSEPNYIHYDLVKVDTDKGQISNGANSEIADTAIEVGAHCTDTGEWIVRHPFTIDELSVVVSSYEKLRSANIVFTEPDSTDV